MAINTSALRGIFFVAIFAAAATYLSTFQIFINLGISPLIIGIILGIIFANTLRGKIPASYTSGIIFSTKTILRTAIVFYGFRLTFQSIAVVGVAGIITSLLIVSLTFIIGYFIGVKILKLDAHTTILTAAGSSICGAAAILATEPIIKAEPYKTAIAVSSVVIFGSIAMFLYPFLYQAGYIDLSPKGMGIYIGGTIHEVAHVVAAGHTLTQETSNSAVIVKMLRVLLLAPFLLILSYWLATKISKNDKKAKITIPWFAINFILVAGFNSFELLSESIVQSINTIDTFALTMAMSALGMETNFKKFKGIGFKPFYLASILFLWLIFGGFYITKFALYLSNTI